MALLEVAAISVASALAAQAGGARRVECVPASSPAARRRRMGRSCAPATGLTIPLYVLIRPRVSDFVYDELELAAMLDDTAHCRSLGCDGVVVGALTPNGEVDRSACARFVEAAHGMGIAYHRAFDLAADKAATLEVLIDLGFERVLTSGSATSAMAGASLLSRLVAQAGERIIVMPGAGIEPSTGGIG